MARASSMVMFGRLTRSRNSLPCERLTKLNFAMNIVFGPTWRNRSLNDSSKPRMQRGHADDRGDADDDAEDGQRRAHLVPRSVSTAITRIS